MQVDPKLEIAAVGIQGSRCNRRSAFDSLTAKPGAAGRWPNRATINDASPTCTRMKWAVTTAACCTALLVSGCGLLKPVKDKLDVVERASPCGRPGKALIVLLPGRFDDPQDLIDHGFADALRSRNIDADLVIPDLHLGYYRARTAVERLHADVVAPRRTAYEQIWLAGISLGGFGSLLYAQLQEAPDGLLLIAPYLGDERIQNEIRGAGGVHQWDPESSRAKDYEIELWNWLRDDAPHSRMTIGYGRDDAFAPANRRLASMLPAGREILVAGGHDWDAWIDVWKRFLDRRTFSACPAAGAR